MFDKSIILSTNKVTLRLLKIGDVDALFKVSNNVSIFDYFPVIFEEKEDLKQWVSERLELFKKEEWLPFVIINNETNEIIGSTSFLGILLYDKRVEIGATWFGTEFQGKGYNKLCKFLLLKFAFETLAFERVELKTDVLNLQSCKAIEKIGAIKEGVFRNHMTMPNNRRRDTVYYSIIKNDWVEIKSRIFQDIN